jgi:hypothetical protein
MPSRELPLEEHRTLVERLHTAPPGGRVREWTLRDDNSQHHHGRVGVAESPLYLRLCWRENRGGATQEVGLYKLDLEALLKSEFIRIERPGATELRLRFVRGEDDVVSIQTRSGGPRLPIGTVDRNVLG